MKNIKIHSYKQIEPIPNSGLEPYFGLKFQHFSMQISTVLGMQIQLLWGSMWC